MSVLALLIMAGGAFYQQVLSPSSFLRSVGVAPPLLCLLCYLFWRLGDKHWKQIIGEQIVLINVRSAELIQCATNYKPDSVIEKTRGTESTGK
jgi:hypothetical protein